MNRHLSAEFRKRFPKVTEKESYAWNWPITRVTISDVLQVKMMQVVDCVDMLQSTNMTSNADDVDGKWIYNELCEDESFDSWFFN
jgi:hypothetical protein